MFKTETHLHTADVSRCSRLHAKKLVELYKAAGYSTIFVSDHFQASSMDTLGDMPWDHKISVFLSGYYRARHAAAEYGITVLPCAEFGFSGTKNHFLAYGITKEFLCANPDLHKRTPEEFARIAHEAGIFIVHAHPFRDANRAPMPQLVDAIEVYNSNPRHENNSALAEALAIEHGLPCTAGSDTHRTEDVALSGIMTETEIKTVADYIKLVKAGKVTVIKSEEMQASY